MGERPGGTVRSPADVLRLVVATASLLALLAFDAVFGGAVVGFTADLLRGLDAIDERVLTAGVVAVRVVGAGLLVTGLVAAVASGRRRALVTVILGVVLGLVLVAVADRWIDDREAPLVALSDTVGALSTEGFPTTAAVAAAAAAVTSAAPWAPRAARRLGWLVVLVLGGACFIAAPLSSIAVAAVLSGWAGGAAAVVLLGGPSRRPSPAAITSGLGAVGLELASLQPASVDARGSTPYFATTADGRRLFVKVLGRDERSADLLFRLYRSARRRRLGDGRPFMTLRQAVEHEALLGLMASRAGVRTPGVAGLGDAAPGGVVLAYEAVAGRSLDRVDVGGITDEVLAGVWAQLAILRRHRIAHRDLRLANVFVDPEGQVWLIDFGFAELAASDLLLVTDIAELLASLALEVGPARSAASGRAVIGDEAIRSARPRLRPGFLSGATRTGLKQEPGLLEELVRVVSASPAPSAGNPVARDR